MATKKDTKKTGFNASQYATDYIKAHYIRKEVKFKQDEAELLKKVLEAEKKTFKAYTIDNLKRDAERLKKDA